MMTSTIQRWHSKQKNICCTDCFVVLRWKAWKSWTRKWRCYWGNTHYGRVNKYFVIWMYLKVQEIIFEKGLCSVLWTKHHAPLRLRCLHKMTQTCSLHYTNRQAGLRHGFQFRKAQASLFSSSPPFNSNIILDHLTKYK